MSFFSKILPEQQENYASKGIVIRTMQDDLDAINGVVRQPQEVTQKKSMFSFLSSNEKTPVANNTASVSSSTNQNPFITQEQPPQMQTLIVPQPQEVIPEVIVQQPLAPAPTPAQVIQAQAQTNPSNQNPFNTAPSQKQEIFIDPRNPFALSGHQTELAQNSTVNINSSHTVRNSIIFILCILALAGGAYYFYTITRNIPETAPATPSAATSTDPIAPGTPLFSVDAPNYLPLDINSTTPASLKVTLTQTAKQVAGLKSEKPVEFFITDSNNNPLSFAAFAKIAGITLSQPTLAVLNDTFSLFIYTNNQSPSIGLSIETKDGVTLQKTLRQDEAMLVQAMTPLFLGEVPSKITGTFRDGTYRNIPLRFMNIDPASGLSTDYAIKGKHLIIGTSMNTHHALLDLIQ